MYTSHMVAGDVRLQEIVNLCFLIHAEKSTYIVLVMKYVYYFIHKYVYVHLCVLKLVCGCAVT